MFEKILGLGKKVAGFVVEKVKKTLETVKYYGQVIVIMVQSLVLGVSPEKIIFAKTLDKLGLA